MENVGIVTVMDIFVSTLARDPFYFLSWVGIVMFSICVHEFAHASMALKRGDDTAARLGHLSLNPFVQMGPMSIIMLMFIGIAWGAVPVNPANFRTRTDAAAVSFAGPAANLLLSLVFGFATAGLSLLSDPSTSLIVRFCMYGCIANGVLFVFNMLPVPMFDGWPIFSLFIPAMRRVDMQKAQNISLLILVFVFITPMGNLIWRLGAVLSGIIMSAWVRFFALFA